MNCWGKCKAVRPLPARSPSCDASLAARRAIHSQTSLAAPGHWWGHRCFVEGAC